MKGVSFRAKALYGLKLHNKLMLKRPLITNSHGISFYILKEDASTPSMAIAFIQMGNIWVSIGSPINPEKAEQATHEKVKAFLVDIKSQMERAGLR